MSLLVLLPVLFSVLVGLGASFYVLKRKSLAQAICVQQATLLQHELKQPLRKLIRMNREARTLRTMRKAADRALQTAVSSGYPPLIAAAQAARLAVIMRQTAFHARQLALLAEAQRLRRAGEREMRWRVRDLALSAVRAQTYYYRPLAVEPRPPLSLSPNYEPIVFFDLAQQHRFHFRVNLMRDFPIAKLGLEAVQSTECSVTLHGQEDNWDIRILTAKAS